SLKSRSITAFCIWGASLRRIASVSVSCLRRPGVVGVSRKVGEPVLSSRSVRPVIARAGFRAQVTVIPVFLHLDKQERSRPGDQHQPRQRLQPGQEFQRPDGCDVTKAYGGEGGKREIHRVHEAAVVIPGQLPEVFRRIHQVIPQRENPDLNGVRHQCAEHAEHHSEAVPDVESGHQPVEPHQAFVMNDNGGGDDQRVDQGDQNHENSLRQALSVHRLSRMGLIKITSVNRCRHPRLF
nr:hypothetical protein [Tanacetum cinerariifolium]